MAKYSHDVRIKVVTEIENGDSIRGIARKYGIAKTAVHRWYRHYQQGGLKDLSVLIKNIVQILKRNAVSTFWRMMYSWIKLLRYRTKQHY